MNVGLQQVLDESALSRAQIAKRAGLHRATVYRAADGSNDLRIDTLEELALACGMEVAFSYRPASVPAAADAGRVMLDADSLDPTSAEVLTWIERLRRYAGEDPLRIAEEAGRYSSLLHRQGAVYMVGDFTPERLASAGYATGKNWALSGAVALEAMEAELPAEVVSVMWVSDPLAVSQLLSDSGRVARRGASSANLILATPTFTTLTGMVPLDGLRLVAPVQAVIDCAGLEGPTRDAAFDVARSW